MKNPIEESDAYIFFLETKNLKYRDLGFLNISKNNLCLELFEAGTVVLRLEIKDKYICLDSYCLSKKEFNKRYLSSFYGDNLLQNVLTGIPIFRGKNYIKTQNGFIQNISEKQYNIRYYVDNKSIEFKDDLNFIKVDISRID